MQSRNNTGRFLSVSSKCIIMHVTCLLKQLYSESETLIGLTSEVTLSPAPRISCVTIDFDICLALRHAKSHKYGVSSVQI